ncbi:M23 family metallopeptidase [Fictibacillus nanhaiensis]|uniref:peptidoglycan DD-metalloendopeptidase family protein n=1 Tax=Fictibacillus nanhaiensis TaxID=742169 RepID=UPI001C97888A|nr:M23 family metallopeptidase [Fictibacillus nanhaiensis]
MQTQNTTERLNHKMMLFLAAVIVTLSTFAMNSSVTYAHHDDNQLIKTIFHVYVDGKKVGTVREQSVVDEAVEQYLQETKEKNGNYAYTINESIELKPEKMFRPEFDNEAASEALKESLSVSLDAYRIAVGSQTIAYVSSEKEALDILLKLKLEHVSKENLDAIEKTKSGNKQSEMPQLQPGESKVIDVEFSTPIVVRKSQVAANELVSVDDAIKRIKEGTLRKKEHIIQEGETVESITEKYHLTLDQFFTMNPRLILTSVIREGERVIVTEKKPFTEVIVYEATRAQREIPFKTEEQEDGKLEKGVTKTLQKGENGLEDITYTLRKADGKLVQKDVLNQKQVKAPVDEILKIGTKVVPSKGTGTLSWPAVGGYISSHKGTRWGREHKGMDIARPSNRSILAADNGTVAFAGWDGDYGNKIIINHNNGMRTVYAHLSSISVSKGAVVQKGSKIGVMGSTGQSTGIHLHFEVYKDGALKDPEDYL